MRSRILRFAEHQIDFRWGCDCLSAIEVELGLIQADRFVVVTDDNVERILGNRLIPILQRVAPTLTLAMRPGEREKNLGTLAQFAERAVAWGASHKTVVVAFGGGVPGNMGGLMAAILFRGIRFVHVPTTLVAMCDSVVSFKQGVNSSLGKNHFGVFYQPAVVLADTRMLESLPEREMRAGVCEMIKNAVAITPQVIDPLSGILRSDGFYDAPSVEKLLEWSLDAKSRVMAEDAFERGAALALEYGHTIGHAIEFLDAEARGEAALSHGEAVGIGMVAAARISGDMGLLDHRDVAIHDRLLHRAGVSTKLPGALSPDRILEKVLLDNKRGYCDASLGCVDMVLLRALGHPVCINGLPLTPVPVDRIRATLYALAT